MWGAGGDEDRYGVSAQGLLEEPANHRLLRAGAGESIGTPSPGVAVPNMGAKDRVRSADVGRN